jgi:EAL domain-containing protein (putative c-di-GMP-specific phosphodiesterase class I)
MGTTGSLADALDIRGDERTGGGERAGGGEAGGPAGRASDVVPRLIRAAREHLGMEVSFVSQFVAGHRVFRHVDADDWNPLQVGAGDPLEQSYCQRVVDGRLPRLITNACENTEALTLPATRALPVGAHVSLPIVLSDGAVYGTFCCFSRQPDPSLTERDLNVLQMFADVASDYVEADLLVERERGAARERITAALDEDGFLTSVYQPIVALRGGGVLGMEALSRFPREHGRSPDVWFSEAAALGLGIDLELRALRTALQAVPHLGGGPYLALNVSPAAVLSGRVAEALADVDGRHVVLEMTEHAPVDDYDALTAALAPLRRRGVRIAVDDAGAGYASLRHILRLEPEWIKLDISITRDLHLDGARAALAAALIGFAEQIGSRIIAEGVEVEGEAQVLRELGATAAQGYHLGRPGRLGDAVARPQIDLR